MSLNAMGEFSASTDHTPPVFVFKEGYKAKGGQAADTWKNIEIMRCCKRNLP